MISRALVRASAIGNVKVVDAVDMLSATSRGFMSETLQLCDVRDAEPDPLPDEGVQVMARGENLENPVSR